MKSEEARILNFEIKTIQGVSVTYGYNISNAFPVHFHSTFNLGVIEFGEREFFYRGIKTVIKPNDIFIIQPFEPHRCKSVDNSIHSYKMVSFNLDTSCYFPSLVIDQPGLLRNLRELFALVESKKLSSRLMCLYEEIISQVKRCSIGSNSSILNKEISTRIQLAKLFIEKNCQRDISLKEISGIACLSEFHFNRFFHTCYGLSPYAYYLVCKMKKSQKSLISHRSLIDTTYDVGFFDQSHFIKRFKKYVGVTPGKYLKDNQIDY